MNRGLVTKALDRIEVNLRTTILHYFGQRHGAFGHIDPINFFVSAPNKRGWFRVTLADALD
jgi:abortive infection bacteriophage resistance protein